MGVQLYVDQETTDVSETETEIEGTMEAEGVPYVGLGLGLVSFGGITLSSNLSLRMLEASKYHLLSSRI